MSAALIMRQQFVDVLRTRMSWTCFNFLRIVERATPVSWCNKYLHKLDFFLTNPPATMAPSKESIARECLATHEQENVGFRLVELALDCRVTEDLAKKADAVKKQLAVALADPEERARFDGISKRLPDYFRKIEKHVKADWSRKVLQK